MAILEAEDVSRIYRASGGPVHALRGVNLRVERGEFVALVGPSGSGKTTFLNIIGGLDRPTEGTVRLEGRDIGSLSQRELTRLRLYHVGFIFQDYNLLPVLTARENVEFVMLLQRVSAKERARRALTVLEEVGLKDLEDRRPAELSGGQQQRVAVARAIVAEPTIVVADEPTANLDSATGAALMELLRRLNQQKSITFIFSTHDPLVIDRARRIVRLRDGAIQEDVTGAEPAT